MKKNETIIKRGNLINIVDDLFSKILEIYSECVLHEIDVYEENNELIITCYTCMKETRIKIKRVEKT